MNKSLKTLLIWIGLLLLVVFAWNLVQDDRPVERRGYADFTADVEAERVVAVLMAEGHFDVDLDDGSRYSVEGYVHPEMVEKLAENEVFLDWERKSSLLSSSLIIWAPVLLLVVLFFYFLRRMRGGSFTSILELRKTPARLLEEKATATFADVGGSVEAKRQLGDLVSFLRDPAPWVSAGARVPRGTLLEGPPGCGKTLLARAVAGETRAKFYLVAASEFVEMFVGVGAARVRDTFETARKNAPAVVFIDELDAVGRRRGSGIGASHDEREQTLNQLLVCLDGLERADRVVVIAATNRPDVLDPALVRPGRFDRRIVIPPFSEDDRLEILEIHARGKRFAAGADLGGVAAATEGASGADLESMINEAAVLAVRRSLAAGDGAAVEITADDLRGARAARTDRELTFDRLDMILVESASQMSEVTGVARARVVLADGTRVEGEVVWADASFVKLRSGGEGRILAKRQIVHIEALAGTEAVDRGELAPDRLAGKLPGLA
jgi:cell division protease FtsH